MSNIRNPNILGRKPPGLDALQSYNVNRPGQIEAVWQPYYHFQTYPSAGVSQMTFFQQTVGTAGTTLADTNMRASGQFPRPVQFLCTGLQVVYLPASAAAKVAAAVDTPSVAQSNIIDTYALSRSGYLRMTIGSKDYLTDAPLGKFPPVWNVDVVGELGPNVNAATLSQVVDYASFDGRYYSITPFMIPSNQNFDVTLNWPTPVAVTGETDRIGVILDGFEYRLSQ
jgi:hypothetical protein